MTAPGACRDKRTGQAGQAAIEMVFMVVAALILIGFLRAVVMFELDVFNRLNVVRYRAFERAEAEQRDALREPRDSTRRLPAELDPSVTTVQGGRIIGARPIPFLNLKDPDSPDLVYQKRQFFMRSRTYPRRWEDINSEEDWLLVEAIMFGFLGVPMLPAPIGDCRDGCAGSGWHF